MDTDDLSYTDAIVRALSPRCQRHPDTISDILTGCPKCYAELGEPAGILDADTIPVDNPDAYAIIDSHLHRVELDEHGNVSAIIESYGCPKCDPNRYTVPPAEFDGVTITTPLHRRGPERR